MADRPGSGLAARFRAAIDRKHDEERQREEERIARQKQAREARRDLLVDLAEFGRAVGHFDITDSGGLVALRFEGRTLRFEAEGDAGLIRVDGDGLNGEVTLFLQGELGQWAIRQVPEKGRERVRLLFDGGLEDLVALSLGVRPLAEGEAPTVVPEDPATRTL